MDLTCTVVRSRDPISTELGAEVAILDVDAGRFYGVDGVGATVWALLERPLGVLEIERALLERYDVGVEECRRDLLGFLDHLVRAGLVTIVESEGGA